MKITESNKCTGCKMCMNICSQHAISFHVNKEGFWYPVIDKSLCIDCGECIRKCPQNRPYTSYNNEPEVYYAWNRNDDIRLKSTSGGIFFALAGEIIKENGSVVGCQYSKNYKSAFHSIAENENDLYKLMGSKYFQSNTENIYARVKKLLRKGKKVLFSGTPCQVDALYTFLDEEYDNLITMDFICLGINSPKAFFKYITEQEHLHKSKVKFVQLKNKKEGWESLATYIEFQNGKTYLGNKDNDLWIKGFIKESLFMRPSCYRCKYRKVPRIADITVGDFWGHKYVGKQNQFKGISAILVNSDKGKKLIEEVNKNIYYKKSYFELLRAGNIALEKDMKWTAERDNFFNLLEKYPFSKAVKKSCKLGSANQKNVLWKRIFAVLNCVDIERKVKVLKRISKEGGIIYLQKHLEEVDVYKFIYYNYISTKIERDEGVYIVPYKNAIIDIGENAKIYVHNKNIEVGINKLKKSKSETHIRLGKNAIWVSKGGAGLFYNTVVEVGRNAIFESGYFTANGGSVIICAKHIVFGENVMLGRNIIVYDSDHHCVLDENDQIRNHPKEVHIQDNVWLTSNVTVLKGVNIEEGSIIGAQTVITKNISPNAMVVGGKSQTLNNNAKWSRKTVR